MRKKFLVFVLLLLPTASKAQEDTATLLQMLVTLNEMLRTTERALNYSEAENAGLALETWQRIGGNSSWQMLDGGMSLNLIGNMSELSFNDGRQTHTIGFNVVDAIKALQQKGDINIHYANEVIRLQTRSIENDGRILRELSAASGSPRGNLQAMQILLQLSIQNIQQMRQIRSHMAFESQNQNNIRAQKAEEERLRKEYNEEFLRFDPPKPRSAYPSYR
jgi:hypothetical protein